MPRSTNITDTTRIFDNTNEGLANVDRTSRQFGASLAAALDQLVIKGRSFDDVLGSLATRLSQIALQAAFKPLEQQLSSVLGNLFSGLSGGGAPSQTFSLPPLPGLMSAPAITAPAIMSAAFDVPGASSRALAPQAAALPPITFNVTAQDAESFRRSETQIAALLARSVARGSRNA